MKRYDALKLCFLLFSSLCFMLVMGLMHAKHTSGIKSENKLKTEHHNYRKPW